jgi:hypothetical protein
MVINPLRPRISNKFVANITDYIPMVNIMPFGMCKSLSNPQVSAATSAAMGALTPMPCIPVLTAPWSPAGKIKVGGMPALFDNAKLMCMWGGSIEIKDPGQSNVKGK